jgi:hypothetical protein
LLKDHAGEALDKSCGVALNLQLSFELKTDLSYSPSFVKMASRLPPQHLQLVEVMSMEVDVSPFSSVSLQ